MNLNTQLTIRLSKPIHNALSEIANDQKVSISESARSCLSAHFNQIEIDDRLTKIDQKLDQIIDSFEVSAE